MLFNVSTVTNNLQNRNRDSHFPFNVFNTHIWFNIFILLHFPFVNVLESLK